MCLMVDLRVNAGKRTLKTVTTSNDKLLMFHYIVRQIFGTSFSSDNSAEISLKCDC